MSSPENKAVFLSYASQDAEAAKRIADALRSAGVEVWFDQSELRGGDAWDQKIRRQIKECTLFVPLISANTQARPEGYFRLEWHLAEQRSLLIAKGRPFLVPVAVDGTSDREALVPDAFLAVQWMKAPEGACSAAFVADVVRLLSGGGVPRASRPAPVGSVPPAPRPSAAKKLIPLALLAAAGAVALAIWQPWVRRAKVLPAAPVAAASPEIAALRARIVPDRWQKGDFEAVNATLDRLLQQDPENADAWALRGIICSLQTMRLIDRGTRPLQDGRAAAERALRIAPESPLANLALGYHLTANIMRGGDPEAGRAPMERAVAALPPDAVTRYGALATAWNAYDIETTGRRAREWLEAEPTATFPAWIMASMSNIARRPDDVLKWGERVTGDPNITGIRAYSTMFDAHFYLRADLSAAASVLERVPPRGRPVARIVFCRWLLHSAQSRHDDALQALAAVPDPFIGDVSFSGPKALLAGLSHRWAGRAEAAAVQFREAERLLRDRLASDAENEEYRVGLALALAELGRGVDARTELALVEPVLRGRAPSLYRGQLFSFVTQVYAALGDSAAAGYYLRRIFTEPSNPPHTPASLRQDPRFKPLVTQPEIEVLLREFALLDPRAGAASDDKSVAVLAFANLSDDKANEYFSDGISEELLNVLAKVPGLKVTARTSAFHFKGKDTPIPEIARQLGVAYVVEGSVRKAGDKVRITAQLIKAADGFHVWSDTFTRDLKDIFAVQDEIAGLIAKNLELKLGQAVDVTVAAALNPEAFRLYLQGREAWNRRDAAGFQQAELLFHRALELEPRFARAHAALADVWMLGATEPVGGYAQRQSPLLMRIIAKAEQAVAMDGKSAEAHASLGHVLGYAWRFADSQRALQRAIELNPNYASAHQWLGRALLEQGLLDEALVTLHRAAELDPLSHRILDNYADALECAGRLEEAWAMLGRAAALHPSGVQIRCKQALLLLRLGRRDEALAAARALAADTAADEPDYRHSTAAAVLSACGEMAEAEASLRRIAQDSEDFSIALLHLGRTREFIAHLDYASINWIHNFWFHPEFAAVRAEPGLRAWTEKVGLAEALARAESWTAAHRGEKPAVKQ